MRKPQCVISNWYIKNVCFFSFFVGKEEKNEKMLGDKLVVFFVCSVVLTSTKLVKNKSMKKKILA